MSYRDGQFLYADEYAAYQHFISTAHRDTWGTMTMEEWKKIHSNQQTSWDDWCKINRPSKTDARERE